MATCETVYLIHIFTAHLALYGLQQSQVITVNIAYWRTVDARETFYPRPNQYRHILEFSSLSKYFS